MNLAINNVVEVAVNRTISAFQPGVGKKDFKSTASTYGQLKAELQQQGFNLRDVRVSEGNTQIDLVNDDAILPTNIQKRGQITNDLIIIMTPREKPKSGASKVNTDTASYKELKATIKDLCNNPKTEKKARAYFGNYTQMSTDNMRKYLQGWYNNNSNTVSSKKPIEAGRNVDTTSKEKLDKIKENLEKQEFTPTAPSPSLSLDSYNEGLQHILYGINLLQNALVQVISSDTPSEDELEELAEKQSRHN